MIRSVLAVLAGISALTVSSFAIELSIHPLLMRMFPEALPNQAAFSRNLGASLFMFAYGALCVAFGGYVAAWVARRFPVRHAVIMGVIQVGMTVLASLSFPDLAPMWHWMIGMALTVPAAWLGGVVRSKHEKQAALRLA